MRVGTLGLRSLRRNLGRFGLTLAGVSLGVGLFVAVLVTDASARAALRDLAPVETRERLLLEGVLGAQVPEDAVRLVAEQPEVARVSAVLRLFAAVEGRPAGDELNVTMIATDELDGSSAGRERPSTDEGGVTLDGRAPRAGRDEITFGGRWALDLLGVEVGEQVRLRTPTGPVAFTITGVWTSEGDEQPAEGQTPFAYVPLDTMRRVTGEAGGFDYADVRLARGSDAGQWVTEHGDRLGDDVRAERFGYWNDELADLVDALGSGSLGIGLVGLFVGGYLVHLTLSMTVVERTRLYGTLRAVGASRRQVWRLVLAEAAGMAALGTVAGLAIGVAAGAAMNRYVATVFGVPAPRLVVPGAALAGAMVLGVLVTLVGAALPGRRAARLSPVAAIRGETGTPRPSRVWVLGAALVATGTTLAAVAPGRRAVDASAMLLLAGAVFVVPGIAGRMAAPVGRLTRRMAPGVGDIAVMHLAKERARAGATLALVMAVLAMIFGGAVTHHSWRAAFDRTVDHRFPADLAVYGQLDEDLLAEVVAADGVAGATPIRFGQADVVGRGGGPVFVTAIDPATYFDVQGVPWTDGDDSSARRSLGEGGGVLLAEGIAARFGATRGGSVVLDTPEGRQHLVVAGVYESVESVRRVVIGRTDADRWFGAGDPAVFAVRVDRGTPAAVVAGRLRERLADRSVFVDETGDVKAGAREGMERFFQLVYALLLAMVVVGLLGLANTLVMSVLRRTREIGVLRAVGTRRRQVGAMVLVEATTLCAVAFVLAVPVGIALAAAILRGAPAGLDVVVDLSVPWAGIAATAALAALVAGLAALTPARRAARVDPVTSLRFE